jgi:hypothetical protein
MSKTIPSHLYRDRYWASMLHLFQNHWKLKSAFTTKYFDLEREEVKAQSLKKGSAAWSSSEKIMMQLALHLFNERHKFNLSDLDYLDEDNKALALSAIKIRFKI